MHLTTTLLALVATLATATPLTKRAGGGACSGGDWVAPTVVGGPDGTSFCESSWGTQNLPITNLTIYSNTRLVRGLQATYSDGTQSPLYGHTAAESVQTISCDYSAGERFTVARLFSWDKRWLRRLHLETTAGTKMSAGVAFKEGVPWQVQDVGEGVLLGMQGSATSDRAINNLGLLFLNPGGAQGIASLQFPGEAPAPAPSGSDASGNAAPTSATAPAPAETTY